MATTLLWLFFVETTVVTTCGFHLHMEMMHGYHLCGFHPPVVTLWLPCVWLPLDIVCILA